MVRISLSGIRSIKNAYLLNRYNVLKRTKFQILQMNRFNDTYKTPQK